MTAITQPEIDQQVFNLYDEYCHGRIDRREFMRRAGALGAAARSRRRARDGYLSPKNDRISRTTTTRPTM